VSGSRWYNAGDMNEVWIAGGGLAGSEAAWQAAERGTDVVLFEMRPTKMTPAHHTSGLAELVCSNSFKSDALTTAHGLLKAELRELGGLLVSLAEEVRVPAGSALAVDREAFSARVEAALLSHPRIRIVREELTALPADRPVLVATGPLTSDAMAAALQTAIGGPALFFFDAIAPIVDAETIDRSLVFAGSRYGQGDDYLNCPLDRAQYDALRMALVGAESAPVKDFDRELLFEGCLPIEELAARGEMTMAFGPLRPVGLVDPRTGRRPYAVVQLRCENLESTMYGLVGFQTRLKHGEQVRIFRGIPGLESAEFLRLGAMHRNAFLDAPAVLDPDLRLRAAPNILVAGQLTGAEGYCEAQATGFIAGVNLARIARGEPALVFPPETALGALTHYLATAPVRPFQPMNFNFGLLPPLARARNRMEKKVAFTERALGALRRFASLTPDLHTATPVAAAAAPSAQPARSAVGLAAVGILVGWALLAAGGCAKSPPPATVPPETAPPAVADTLVEIPLPPEPEDAEEPKPAPSLEVAEEMAEELPGGTRHVKLVVRGTPTRAGVTAFLEQYVADHRPDNRELWVSVFLPGMDLQSIEYALAIARPGQSPKIMVRESVQTYR
jgi:methylenetetrahydrofolate--tRNA-(uracil-5-)-methyltransferase